MNWTKGYSRSDRLSQESRWRRIVARFVLYEDCIGTLSPRENLTRIPGVRQWRHAPGVYPPHPLHRGTPGHLIRHDTRCQPEAVAERLRPMLGYRKAVGDVLQITRFV